MKKTEDLKEKVKQLKLLVCFIFVLLQSSPSPREIFLSLDPRENPKTPVYFWENLVKAAVSIFQSRELFLCLPRTRACARIVSVIR